MILCTSLFNKRLYHEQGFSLSPTEIRAFLCFRVFLLIVNISLTHYVHESSNVWNSYYQTHGYLIIFPISQHIFRQNYFTNHKQSLSNARRILGFSQILRYMEDTCTGVLNYSVSFWASRKIAIWFKSAWLFLVGYYISYSFSQHIIMKERNVAKICTNTIVNIIWQVYFKNQKFSLASFR